MTDSPPDTAPDLDLPMRGTTTVFVVGLLGFFGGLALLAAVIGVLGVSGIIDTHEGESLTGYWVELIIGLPIAIALLFMLRQYMRRRLKIFGSEIWLRRGFWRTTDRFVVDLSTVDQAVVVTRSGGRYTMVDLHFLTVDSERGIVMDAIPEYGATGQRRLHGYLTQYVQVTGTWWLGFGRYIQREDTNAR